jgi:hypothetical protein
MFEVAHAIPDHEFLLKLTPEELGAKLLFLLQRRKFQNDIFQPSVPINEYFSKPPSFNLQSL